MRHVLLSGAVTTAAGGVLEAATATALVAFARLAQRVTPRRFRAITRAVELASVAVAADEYLDPTTRTEKESA